MQFVCSATVLTLALSTSAVALAQTSGGSGGPIGETEDWPCPGCIMGTPDNYDSSQPTPLLITFHGDEGYPGYIHGAYYGTNWSDGPAPLRGILVLSLQCPVELGCDLANPDGDPSWWRWRGSDYYDPDWVGQQIDAVEAAYDVELRRIYAGSFSGGSSFLRSYGFENADRLAGLIISGGGGNPARDCLDACKIPVFLSIGDADYLYDLAQDTRQYAIDCEHELNYSEHAGIEHEIIVEDLPVALDWMLARPHPCIEATGPGTGGAMGVGGAPGSGGSAVGSGGEPMGTGGDAVGSGGEPLGTGGDSVGTGGAVAIGGTLPVDPGAAGSIAQESAEDAGDESGCTCRTSGGRTGPGWLLVLPAAIGLLRRRRLRRSS